MDLHHLLLAGLPAHSGLPREADIFRVLRHVSKVLQADHIRHRNVEARREPFNAAVMIAREQDGQRRQDRRNVVRSVAAG
jgi:hypothetical protein